MANGGEFNENKYRAASWDYALGTRLKVSSVVTGRSVIVTVTDRTARRFKGKRIDLSRAAMEALGGQWAINKGLLNVKIEKAG
jgi:rare lipoprotein A